MSETVTGSAYQQVADYMTRTGWTADRAGPAGTMWCRAGRQVGVFHELEPRSAEWHAVITRLAAAEGRSAAEVTAGILGPEDHPHTCSFCRAAAATHLAIIDWVGKPGRQERLACENCGNQAARDTASVVPQHITRLWLYALTLEAFQHPAGSPGRTAT